MDELDDPLVIEHDLEADLLIVNGVRYSGHLFRMLSLCEPGTWLRLESRRDGVVSVFSPSTDLERAFDAMTGKGAISGQ